IDDGRLDQRAVRGDADHDRGALSRGSLVVAVEHVVLAAAETGPATLLAKSFENIVSGLRRSGDDHHVQRAGAPQPGTHSSQHRFAPQVLQYLAWQPAAAHARLHDGHGPHATAASGANSPITSSTAAIT